MQTIIEIATVTDAHPIAHLYIDYLKEFDVIKDPNGFSEFMEMVIGQPNITILVLRDVELGIIGFTSYTISYSPVTSGLMILVNDLYVIPNKRKNGFGPKLLIAIEDRCDKQNGFSKIIMDVDPKRENLNNIYVSIGYRFTGNETMIKILS